jgi:hypothetical protein
MANQKKKSLLAQIATQGATKGQQRIIRRVHQYDEHLIMNKPQPLAVAPTQRKKDAAGLGKPLLLLLLPPPPPTKWERKIVSTLKRQTRSGGRQVRQAYRSNIAALLDVTKGSRASSSALIETDHV